jgi:hypothetical protein
MTTPARINGQAQGALVLDLLRERRAILGQEALSATLVQRRSLGPAQRADGVHLHADGDGLGRHSHSPARQQLLGVGVEAHTGPPERGDGTAAPGQWSER